MVERIERFQTVRDSILAQVRQVIVGQDDVLDQILIALFVGGHCLITGMPGHFPLNIPNRGQVADLPADVVVESMSVVDGDGVRGRDVVHVPTVLADTLRRVSTAQELTVDAALTGDRERVVDAMLVDPLAGRIDYDAVRAMTDELLMATKRWLPQFA